MGAFIASAGMILASFGTRNKKASVQTYISFMWLILYLSFLLLFLSLFLFLSFSLSLSLSPYLPQSLSFYLSLYFCLFPFVFCLFALCLSWCLVCQFNCDASSDWSSLGAVLVGYSVVSGLGFGLMYIPSVVGAAPFFNKRRSLAIGRGLNSIRHLSRVVVRYFINFK